MTEQEIIDIENSIQDFLDKHKDDLEALHVMETLLETALEDVLEVQTKLA